MEANGHNAEPRKKRIQVGPHRLTADRAKRMDCCWSSADKVRSGCGGPISEESSADCSLLTIVCFHSPLLFRDSCDASSLACVVVAAGKQEGDLLCVSVHVESHLQRLDRERTTQISSLQGRLVHSCERFHSLASFFLFHFRRTLFKGAGRVGSYSSSLAWGSFCGASSRI